MGPWPTKSRFPSLMVTLKTPNETLGHASAASFEATLAPGVGKGSDGIFILFQVLPGM